MPRRPKQQTLVTPVGKDPSNFAGTPEAKEKMARVRAARAQKLPEPPPVQMVAAQNPMQTAMAATSQLLELAEILMESNTSGPMSRAQVVALLMKGLELGVGPVEAVQSLYFTTEGKIEANSELMRALVGRSGVGVIEITNYADEIVSLQATRYGVGGRPDVSKEFTYTVHDAQRAGLFDEKWRKWPRAMCLARCTSEACRAVFPDVLLGASYAPGEIGGTVKVEHPPAEELPAKGADAASDLIATEQQVKEAVRTAITQEMDAQDFPPTSASEPRTAPPEAEASPEPDPVAEEVTGTVLVSGPNGDIPPPGAEAPEAVVATDALRLPELVHKFPADAPGGGVRIVQTAGIQKEQLQRIGDLTTARAGQPNWQALQQVARAWLKQLGLPDLKYLNEGQGARLIATLQATTAQHQPPAGGTEHDRLLDTVLAETATQHLREKVVQVLVRSAKVDQLTQITIPDLRTLLAQMKGMVTDPQVFGLMIDQLLADNPPVV